MTMRQEKVNSLLKREISTYLFNADIEQIKGILTITSVEVSPDLEYAKVFFSVIGQGEEEIQAILKQHTYAIQGMLKERLRMRKIPHIAFIPDYSGEYIQHIGELINKVRRESGKQKYS